MKKIAGYTVDVLEERHDNVLENLQVHRSKLAAYFLISWYLQTEIVECFRVYIRIQNI